MNDTHTHRYTRDDLTILWQPTVCIHSGRCFRGLPSVFDPRVKPWIDMSGAELEAIANQVHHCPSGALSLETKEEAAG